MNPPLSWKEWTDEALYKTGGKITCLEVKENLRQIHQIRAR